MSNRGFRVSAGFGVVKTSAGPNSSAKALSSYRNSLRCPSVPITSSMVMASACSASFTTTGTWSLASTARKLPSRPTTSMASRMTSADSLERLRIAFIAPGRLSPALAEPSIETSRHSEYPTCRKVQLERHREIGAAL